MVSCCGGGYTLGRILLLNSPCLRRIKRADLPELSFG
jgi:hypothetical protein